MSTTEADRIRAEIDGTRHEVSRDVDALADKVSPSKIVERKTRKVRSAVSSVKASVMGAVGSAQDGVAEGAEAIGEGADRAVVAAKGHPLAVGLVAFGIGWIASALVPASAVERRAANTVKDAAAPVLHEAGDALAEAADNLREPAREAASNVGDAAASAVQHVRTDANDAMSDLSADSSSDASSGWDPATASGPVGSRTSSTSGTSPVTR